MWGGSGVADDYVGMRPTLLVSEGDRVELGQPLFSDKKTEGVVFTAPAGGRSRPSIVPRSVALSH